MEGMRGWPAVILLVAAAFACAVIALLYLEGVLQIFTSTGTGHHRTHAILFGGLAVVCLIAASFLRPRPEY